MEDLQEQNEFTDGLGDGLTLSPVGESSEKDKLGEDGKPKPGDEGKPELGEDGKPLDTQKDGDVTTLLSETFGGKYKTVDELKEANIPGQLEELEKLRDANKTLQGQLDKPALGFANEGIGKFNQFVKDTGIDDYGVFNKLDKTDLVSMDPMDALVLQETIDNPAFMGNESQVKKMIIKKYNVNPKDVEDEKLSQDDFDLNKLSLDSAAAKAKTSLGELKGKIRMPDKPEDTSQKTNVPTDDELKESRQTWGTVIGSMFGKFEELPLNPDGTKEPYMKYSVTPESKQALTEFVVNYCVRNQLEPKKENIAEISDVIIGKYLKGNFNSILKVYGNKLRGDVTKEIEEKYDHPSALKGDEKGPTEKFDEDGSEAAFKAEMEG